MKSRKHLWTTCSVLLVAALLAACAAPVAAPAATPVPPTPIPPAPTPSLLDFAQAYESAWNSFDPDALTALFAEPFTYTGYPITDVTAWAQGWPYGMAMGLQMKIELRDCQVSDDTITCTVRSDTDCFDMDVTEAYTVKDGKITDLVHSENLEESRKWDQYSSNVEMWARSQKIEEWPAYENEVAKGAYGYEWGVLFTALCKQYESAQAQAKDLTAMVQAWIDAINNGDLDVALALMTQDATFQGVFTDPPPDVLGWFIDGTFNYGVPDCQPRGDQLACTFPFNDDGCIAAHGADDLTAKMDFAFQDGKIHRVSVMEGSGNWAGYDGWLGEMFAWANANHADELAQVDFQHQTKGADIVVKLCQEYAAAQAQDPTAVVQAWLEALNNGDLDAALALMTPDAEIPGWGSAPARNVLDWWIDIKSRYGAPDCQEADDRLVCNYTMNDDGCITAFGNTAGLPLRYTFDMQDGKIQRVSGVETSDADWSSYAKWSEEMEAWATAFRAEEWAKIDLTTFSEGGEIIVKLCQEYAESLK